MKSSLAVVVLSRVDKQGVGELIASVGLFSVVPG